jgi:hypothetical protein
VTRAPLPRRRPQQAGSALERRLCMGLSSACRSKGARWPSCAVLTAP